MGSSSINRDNTFRARQVGISEKLSIVDRSKRLFIGITFPFPAKRTNGPRRRIVHPRRVFVGEAAPGFGGRRGRSGIGGERSIFKSKYLLPIKKASPPLALGGVAPPGI